MSLTRVPLVALLFVAALFASSAASAGISAKKANQRVRAASKASLKLLKNSAKAALDALTPAILAFEAAAKTHTLGASELSDLAQAFSDAQVDVRTALTGDNFYVGASNILGDYADGADLHGNYPTEFRFGRASTVADYARAANDTLDALYSKLEKRLRKTQKLLEEEGIYFTFLVSRPGDLLLACPNPQSSSHETGEATLLVDGVFAISEKDAVDDGTFVVTGVDTTIADVEVSVSAGSMGGGSIAATESLASDRFIIPPTGPVAEGNYLGDARDDDTPSQAHDAFQFSIR